MALHDMAFEPALHPRVAVLRPVYTAVSLRRCFALDRRILRQRQATPFGIERGLVGDEMEHDRHEPVHFESPERESRSQSLRKPRVKSTRRGGCVRLLAAAFFKLREHFVRAFEPGRPRLHHFLRLGHGPAGLRVRHLEFEREGLIDRHRGLVTPF